MKKRQHIILSQKVWAGMILAALMARISILEASSQDATMDANVTITRPAASCTVSSGTDLSFGTLQISSTNGGAGVVPTSASDNDAARYTTTGGVTQTGSPSWGTVTVTANNTSTASNVALTYPNALRRDGCSGATGSDGLDCTIAFSGGATGWSATQSTTSYSSGGLSIPASSVGSSTTRYYRVGGSISGVGLSKAVAVYEGEITIAVTCGT